LTSFLDDGPRADCPGHDVLLRYLRIAFVSGENS